MAEPLPDALPRSLPNVHGCSPFGLMQAGRRKSVDLVRREVRHGRWLRDEPENSGAGLPAGGPTRAVGCPSRYHFTFEQM